MNDFKFELGMLVKDKVTGHEGVVVGRTQWLNNCNTYSTQSRVLKDGVPSERQHFDEPQLELVSSTELCERKSKTGGPNIYVGNTNRL